MDSSALTAQFQKLSFAGQHQDNQWSQPNACYGSIPQPGGFVLQSSVQHASHVGHDQKNVSSGFMSTRLKESDGSMMSQSDADSYAKSRRHRLNMCSKQRESDEESDVEDDASMKSEEHQDENKGQTIWQSLQSTEKEGQTTLPDTQAKMQIAQEEIIDNVVDIVSQHSKMIFQVQQMPQQTMMSSVQSSKFSTKAKQRNIKAPKKVNFFCLKPENIVEIEDIDSQGVEDFNDSDIEEMNKSIEKDQSKNLKLKRNPKSFNYTHEMWNEMDTQLMHENSIANMTPQRCKQ